MESQGSFQKKVGGLKTERKRERETCYTALKTEERIYESRNAGSLYKVGKTRNRFLLRAFKRSSALFPT